MRRLTVTLETVTPLFLGGADPRGVPELRAPSLRGMLRYWLRAALGGVLGDHDLEALQKAEAAVFGSTNGTGSIVIRVKWKDSEPKPISQNVLAHPSATRPAYLKAYPANEAFEVYLLHRGGSENAFFCAIGALMLLVSHGGLGKRTRRGWGSLRIIDYNLENGNLPPEVNRWLQPRDFYSPGEWIKYQQDFCRNTAIVCQELISSCGGTPKNPSLPSGFAIVTPQTRRFAWEDSFPNWLSAISEFGEREHQFVKENPQYADAFGFARGRQRQASPLWVRIFPVRKKDEVKFHIGMCLLESRFRGADYGAVERFIRSYPLLG